MFHPKKNSKKLTFKNKNRTAKKFSPKFSQKFNRRFNKRFNQRLNRSRDKKIRRLLSRLAFSPAFLRRNKKRFLSRGMRGLTYKRLSVFEENKTDKKNCLSVMAMKNLWSSAKLFKREYYKKKFWRKALKKYVKRYFKRYLKHFKKKFKKDLHKENNSKAALRYLRQRQETKLPPNFFKPWKKMRLHFTKRQHWLKTTYHRYRNLRFQDRIDFFRTNIGQIISNIYSTKLNSNSGCHISLPQKYLEFRLSHKKGWWYENLIQKKKKPKSAKRFRLAKPKTAFQIHWTQQKLEPWKSALIFKRALYAGFGEDSRKENKFRSLKIKDYLRSKNPRHEKKNRLYARANLLLNNFRQRYRIRADKFMRIKQIVGKIISPFYGHLRPKQIKNILKKSKKIKTNAVTKSLGWHENVLSRFENRLDVVVFRLNLSPSILWARRLIKAGFIFVTSAESDVLWESMYRGFKKFSFPLKLRDPKNLYSKKYWNLTQENWIQFKFLGQPKKKISYLLQPGDLIQCAPGTFLNDFKTKSLLCRKPIPAHILIQKKKNYVWQWHSEELKKKTFNSWEQNSESILAAIFLNSPQYHDLDSKDRIKESFLRWAMF